MATMRAQCSKCGKAFKHAASIEKYHGWCGGNAVPIDGAPPERTSKGKDTGIDALLAQAEAAGEAAAKAHTPEPMHVVERANPLDDSSPIVKRYEPVMGGVCGFAWVWVKGNSTIARAAKKRYAERGSVLNVHKGYPTGLNIWVSGFGQSLSTKEAYANAYAKVLREAGHNAYAESRMD